MTYIALIDSPLRFADARIDYALQSASTPSIRPDFLRDARNVDRRRRRELGIASGHCMSGSVHTNCCLDEREFEPTVPTIMC